MSNKKYEHWNDKYHDDKGTEHSKIEELAGNIYNELEKYLLEDIDKILKEDLKNESPIKKRYILRRFNRIMDNVEAMRGAAINANSVYALYACDYQFRREMWLKARGLCFEINAQLNSIANITVEGTNIEKYTRLAGKTYQLAGMIKNNMVSDDNKKKKYCKPYENIEN